MRCTISTVLSVAVLCAGTTVALCASPEDALDSTVRVAWVDAKLTDALADLAAQGGVGFVLDPAIPADSRSAKVTYASDQVSMNVALGRALKAAGLRYAVAGGAIWISTPQRVAERIVYKGDEGLAEAEPMSRGEALELLSPPDDEPGIGDLSATQNPWKRPAKPSVNPATGVVDFPAPPVWIASEDEDSPRFKYQSQPSFLKPEYRNGKSEGGDALGQAIDLIKKHKEWSRDEILKALEELLSAVK